MYASYIIICNEQTYLTRAFTKLTSLHLFFCKVLLRDQISVETNFPTDIE